MAFQTRPLGENCEETSGVLGDSPGILAAQIQAEPRLPNLSGPID
jgi:hypothetical protein